MHWTHIQEKTFLMITQLHSPPSKKCHIMSSFISQIRCLTSLILERTVASCSKPCIKSWWRHRHLLVAGRGDGWPAWAGVWRSVRGRGVCHHCGSRVSRYHPTIQGEPGCWSPLWWPDQSPSPDHSRWAGVFVTTVVAGSVAITRSFKVSRGVSSPLLWQGQSPSS